VNWVVKLHEYLAPDDVWDELQPHTEASYGAYLRWYLTRTRPYVTLSRIDDAEHQHAPFISDTYPLYCDQAQRGAVRLSQLQLLNLFKKVDNNITLLSITQADRSDPLHGGRSCISDHVV
jgi:hypothetical protein